MIIKPGICDICNVTVILKKEKGRTIITPQYTEITLILSDGSIATHGVCESCKNKITEADIHKTIENIKETWISELVGSATTEHFDKIRSLQHEGWDKDERKALDKARVIKKQKEKARLEKLKEIEDKEREGI